jgi:hypothetical protein
MKKLLMAALLFISAATSAFAKDSKSVNTAASNNFAAEYKKASNVTWTATENYIKASFIMNSERMEAFYNSQGEKIGTSKAFNIENLPVHAKRAFAKKYQGYTVQQAIEFEGNDETAYFISAENDKESVILKVNMFDNMSTYQRTKK